jgi:hypothetical protein
MSRFKSVSNLGSHRMALRHGKLVTHKHKGFTMIFSATTTHDSFPYTLESTDMRFAGIHQDYTKSMTACFSALGRARVGEHTNDLQTILKAIDSLENYIIPQVTNPEHIEYLQAMVIAYRLMAEASSGMNGEVIDQAKKASDFEKSDYTLLLIRKIEAWQNKAEVDMSHLQSVPVRFVARDCEVQHRITEGRINMNEEEYVKYKEGLQFNLHPTYVEIMDSLGKPVTGGKVKQMMHPTLFPTKGIKRGVNLESGFDILEARADDMFPELTKIGDKRRDRNATKIRTEEHNSSAMLFESAGQLLDHMYFEVLQESDGCWNKFKALAMEVIVDIRSYIDAKKKLIEDRSAIVEEARKNRVEAESKIHQSEQYFAASQIFPDRDLVETFHNARFEEYKEIGEKMEELRSDTIEAAHMMFSDEEMYPYTSSAFMIAELLDIVKGDMYGKKHGVRLKHIEEVFPIDFLEFSMETQFIWSPKGYEARLEAEEAEKLRDKEGLNVSDELYDMLDSLSF